MKSKAFSLISILVILTFFITAFIPAAPVLAQGGPREGGGTPTLKSPYGTILDTTPNYKWTVIPTATKYHYQVWNASTKVIEKWPGSGKCDSVYCIVNPGVTLKTSFTYRWRVRSFVGTWNAWSEYQTFTVSPPGFDSQFTGGAMDQWARRAGGTWYILNGWLITQGQVGKFTSVYQTRGQYTNFDYSININRAQSSNPNWIMVRAGPLIIKSDLEWGPGYMFGFTNEGYFRVWLSKGDGSHVDITPGWIATSAYNINQWNTFRIRAVGSSFKYYINGTEVYSFTDSTYAKGYVGFQTTLITASEGAVYVDWAKLTVLVARQ